MSVEGIYKGITRAKKEGNSIEGTGGQKRGQTRNCNLPNKMKRRDLNRKGIHCGANWKTSRTLGR